MQFESVVPELFLMNPMYLVSISHSIQQPGVPMPGMQELVNRLSQAPPMGVMGIDSTRPAWATWCQFCNVDPNAADAFDQMSGGMSERLNVRLVDTKGMTRTAALQEIATIKTQSQVAYQPVLDMIKVMQQQQQQAAMANKAQRKGNMQGQFDNPAEPV